MPPNNRKLQSQLILIRIPSNPDTSANLGGLQSLTGHDTSEILALKDNQITDLKAQLEKAEMREATLIDEKAKRLDILSAEKEEKRALMPPADEKPKSRNWLLRLVGAR